jgi:hypothetical protein
MRRMRWCAQVWALCSASSLRLELHMNLHLQKPRAPHIVRARHIQRHLVRRKPGRFHVVSRQRTAQLPASRVPRAAVGLEAERDERARRQRELHNSQVRLLFIAAFSSCVRITGISSKHPLTPSLRYKDKVCNLSFQQQRPTQLTCTLGVPPCPRPPAACPGRHAEHSRRQEDKRRRNSLRRGPLGASVVRAACPAALMLRVASR